MPKQQLRLGEILVKEGLITNEQLEKALAAQKQDPLRKPIGETLVSMGFITEENLALALSKQLQIPYLSIQGGSLKLAKGKDLEKLIPENFARENKVVPLYKTDKNIGIVTADPLNIMLLDNINHMTGLEATTAIATMSDISKAIDEFYGESSLYKDAIKEVSDASPQVKTDSSAEQAVTVEEIDVDRLQQKTDDAPIVKLVDLLLMEAINSKTSDIHIEPFESKLSIRYRIDGVLYEMPPPAKHLAQPLVSRIKILSKLDISEKRLPQDGGFRVKMKEKVVD
ncbi:MAG: ATPase, T2SS/T4P/T4SS family, partial [Candidatus Omnitrophota bacterium]